MLSRKRVHLRVSHSFGSRGGALPSLTVFFAPTIIPPAFENHEAKHLAQLSLRDCDRERRARTRQDRETSEASGIAIPIRRFQPTCHMDVTGSLTFKANTPDASVAVRIGSHAATWAAVPLARVLADYLRRRAEPRERPG